MCSNLEFAPNTVVPICTSLTHDMRTPRRLLLLSLSFLSFCLSCFNIKLLDRDDPILQSLLQFQPVAAKTTQTLELINSPFPLFKLLNSSLLLIPYNNRILRCDREQRRAILGNFLSNFLSKFLKLFNMYRFYLLNSLGSVNGSAFTGSFFS